MLETEDVATGNDKVYKQGAGDRVDGTAFGGKQIRSQRGQGAEEDQL